ncbi:hypothetical protein [Stenotrophomonas maltophilia]|uniref:hypothetical protein n=1 Tax=Stenotrophomonas maltophilia TaxID=40324 RepID=UPI00209B5EB1|nr:hypothetical protein [Stenotrophomonas maltophilia]MCO7486362.1 hypothetical protein [Stenotrophomonas maltophilia]
MNRVRSQARHHHLISAGIAGAVTLAGSCLLPVLVLLLPAGFSPGEFIMPVADGAAQLRSAGLLLLAACALATFAGLWASAPSPEPASTARRMVVSLILLATTLLISLASMAYLMRTLSSGTPTTAHGLVAATVVGALLQFLSARVLTSRWLRVQAS